jgi:hypothetical protein
MLGPKSRVQGSLLQSLLSLTNKAHHGHLKQQKHHFIQVNLVLEVEVVPLE